MGNEIGCTVIRDADGPTGAAKKALFERGENLCDHCPYTDCKATATQAADLQRWERKYREETLPQCDRDIRRRVELEKKQEDNARRRLRRNPTGRRQGRPRKAEKGA